MIKPLIISIDKTFLEHEKRSNIFDKIFLYIELLIFILLGF